MKLVDMEIVAQTMIVWKGKPYNKGKVIEDLPEAIALRYVGKGMGKIVKVHPEPKPKKTIEKKEKGGDE